MRRIVIDDAWKPLDNCGSKGFQRKWYNERENLYVKEGLKYTYPSKDYYVEVLSTAILRQLNIPGIRYADYSCCEIVCKGAASIGCVSPNFLRSNEVLVTLHVLNSIAAIGRPIRSGDVTETLLNILNLFLYFGVEHYNEYLAVMFLVDYLLVNIDRHQYNINVIFNKKTKQYTIAPLFDFGYGLLQSGDMPNALSLEEKVKYLRYEPFDEPFDMILELFMYQGYIQKYIPSVLDVSGLIFPERDALILFLRQCNKLGIKVIRDRRK